MKQSQKECCEGCEDTCGENHGCHNPSCFCHTRHQCCVNCTLSISGGNKEKNGFNCGNEYCICHQGKEDWEAQLKKVLPSISEPFTTKHQDALYNLFRSHEHSLREEWAKKVEKIKGCPLPDTYSESDNVISKEDVLSLLRGE